VGERLRRRDRARSGPPDVVVDDRLRGRGYASALDAQEYFFDLRSD
jgi:hypothetical protein